ncbi:MAG: transporter ATP-binding protein [Acidimicrobiaceae bacterium]|nr:transporter ATP-binding protein [Acidimicrobiaceae bacterium]
MRRLLHRSGTADAAGRRTPDAERATVTPGISADKLRVEIQGRTLLEDVSLSVGPGRWLSIVGPNGAGKTTLLRALACLVRHEGRVRVGETALEGLRAAERARLVAYVPQHPVVPSGVTVRAYVLLGRTCHLSPLGAERAVDFEVTERVLEELDLVSYGGRLLSSLSGGERQRAVLARALAQEAPVLLLDEPTTGLDIGYQQEVLDRIEKLRRDARWSVLSTMHDLTLAGSYADELALLVGGRVVASGSPLETLTEENLALFTRARVRLLIENGIPVVVPLGRAEAPDGNRLE